MLDRACRKRDVPKGTRRKCLLPPNRVIVAPVAKPVRLMKHLVLSALLGSLPVAAMARTTSNDTFTGRSLYSACTHNVSDANTKEDIEFIEQICTGYLRGLTDALFVMQSLTNVGQKTCLPRDQAISVAEAREVFQTYLRGHPQAISNSAGLVAAMSLVAAYKCP